MDANLVAGGLHAASSLGIAEAALAVALAGMAPKVAEHGPAPRARAGREAEVELSAVRASVARAGDLIDAHLLRPADEVADVFADVQAAKAFVNEAAVRVVDKALALSGGAGYKTAHPLSGRTATYGRGRSCTRSARTARTSSSARSPSAWPRPSAEDGRMPREGRTALAVLCTAQFLLVLDITAVFVAVPAMGTDLGLSPGARGAVVGVYALALGLGLLPAGRLADVIGRRRRSSPAWPCSARRRSPAGSPRPRRA